MYKFLLISIDELMFSRTAGSNSQTVTRMRIYVARANSKVDAGACRFALGTTALNETFIAIKN